MTKTHIVQDGERLRLTCDLLNPGNQLVVPIEGHEAVVHAAETGRRCVIERRTISVRLQLHDESGDELPVSVPSDANGAEQVGTHDDQVPTDVPSIADASEVRSFLNAFRNPVDAVFEGTRLEGGSWEGDPYPEGLVVLIDEFLAATGDDSIHTVEAWYRVAEEGATHGGRIYESGRGRKVSPRGKLAVEAIKIAVELYLDIRKASVTRQGRIALIELVEGAREFGYEPYVLYSEVLVHGSRPFVKLRNLMFIHPSATEARVSVREALIEELKSRVGDYQPTQDLLKHEISMLRDGRSLRPGGNINIYQLLSVPNSLVRQTLEARQIP